MLLQYRLWLENSHSQNSIANVKYMPDLNLIHWKQSFNLKPTDTEAQCYSAGDTLHLPNYPISSD